MLLISFQKEMQRFDALIYHSLIFKSVTQFWSKFGGSRRHEISKAVSNFDQSLVRRGDMEFF